MARKVAILPWGNVIEDFLDTIGLSLEGFATRMSGGWLFGYVAALRAVGIDSCIVCVSDAEREMRRIVHPDTGLVTVVLPVRAGFGIGRALVGNPDRAPKGGTAGRVQSLLRYAATPGAALGRALEAEGCTHLLCQEYENPRFDIASRVARRKGLKAFASFQGGVLAETALERRLRRGSIRRADGLIVAAGPELERLRRTYGDDLPAVAQICNPLDMEEWRPEPRDAARRALGIPAETFAAICHCRIDFRRKGLDVLLEGWRRLAARHPERPLRLTLVGSGADDAMLEAEIARQEVPGLVWDRGYDMDRPALRRKLSAADVYVLASRHEGFPVAPLEAMACGLPVVLSSAAAAADIVPDGAGQGGLAFPTGDVDALVAALERMMGDAAGRDAMAAAARRRVAAIASVEAVGRQLDAFLGAAPDAGRR